MKSWEEEYWDRHDRFGYWHLRFGYNRDREWIGYDLDGIDWNKKCDQCKWSGDNGYCSQINMYTEMHDRCKLFKEKAGEW